jgi:WD40 repeat protein
VAVGELDGRPVAVSGGGDSTVRVWDLATGDSVGDPFTGHPIVVSGGGDSTVRVWDPAAGGNPRVIRLDVSV